MRERWLLFCLLLIFSSCKKEETPDLTSGLVVNALLDGNGMETVSNTSGIVKRALPTYDRNNDVGKAMQFNRNDSCYIDFGDLAGASFPDDVFTITCWVKASSASSSMTVLSKRNIYGPWEYSLDNHFDNAVFNLDNWQADGGHTVYGVDPLDASAAIATGTWKHIAYVADGTSLKVYVGGSLQSGTDAREAGVTFSNTDAHFVIGNGGGYGKNYYFNGAIDDVKIYNRVLDATTIQYMADH